MKNISFIALLFLGFSSGFAQTSSDQGSLESGTLESQFDYVYRVSNNYEAYKVIRKTHFNQLKSNVQDSLATIRKDVVALKQDVLHAQDSIQIIQNQLDQAESEKALAIKTKDSFSFLGLPIQKTLFATIMWLLVIGLALALAYFSMKYFGSFSRIKKAEQDLDHMQQEFDQHRKNTLERERKLKRQLIDAQMGKS